MNEDGVLAAELLAHLADGLGEGSDSMSRRCPRFSTMVTSAPLDETLRMAFFDLVGDVGDDLDGFAEIIAGGAP